MIPTYADRSRPLSKMDITNLRKRGTCRCRLPACSREFMQGDMIVKVGRRAYYHVPCLQLTFQDRNETEAEAAELGEETV